MALIWTILGVAAGYWVSEWPRYVLPASTRPIPRRQMTEPGDRRFAALLVPWSFGLGAPVALLGCVSAYHLAPELWDRFFGAWAVFVIFGATGIAVGLFEIASGLTPDFHPWNAGAESPYYVDRARAWRVGSWRVGSCAVVQVMVIILGRAISL